MNIIEFIIRTIVIVFDIILIYYMIKSFIRIKQLVNDNIRIQNQLLSLERKIDKITQRLNQENFKEDK